jgi:hypothetical protein
MGGVAFSWRGISLRGLGRKNPFLSEPTWADSIRLVRIFLGTGRKRCCLFASVIKTAVVHIRGRPKLSLDPVDVWNIRSTFFFGNLFFLIQSKQAVSLVPPFSAQFTIISSSYKPALWTPCRLSFLLSMLLMVTGSLCIFSLWAYGCVASRINLSHCYSGDNRECWSCQFLFLRFAK